MFEQLIDCIDLWKNGRKNAAKARWNELSQDFRKKVMQLVLEIESLQEFVFDGLQLAGPCGILPLDKTNLQNISMFVPELLCG